VAEGPPEADEKMLLERVGPISSKTKGIQGMAPYEFLKVSGEN
jgi:hypothetical protein